jgi:hypothetical protein
MAFAADTTLAAKVVPAATGESGARPGGISDIRAICIHMAQGGGTVSHLTHKDGNSSHYVVEYSGRVVQMVREAHWAGSINPKLIRKDEDPTFSFLGASVTFGRDTVLATIGKNPANDPNRFVIAIEIEGFARKAPEKGESGFHPLANPRGGPNRKQRVALAALVADIRKRRNKPYPCLGHRDFQNYKACPGRRIPWVDYGGHAIKADGGAVHDVHDPTPDPIIDPTPDPPAGPNGVFTLPAVRTLARIKAGGVLYSNAAMDVSPANIEVDPSREMPLLGVVGTAARVVEYVTSAGAETHEAVWIKTTDIESERPAP